MKLNRLLLLAVLSGISLFSAAQVSLTVDVNKPGVKMSQDLIGAFFEDINYGADGGLYAELIQNRSFEYRVINGYTNGGPLTSWSPVQIGDASVTLNVENSSPLNANNTNYLKMDIINQGTLAGVQNSGFNGIALKANEKYDFSVYLKRTTDFDKPVIVQLRTSGGGILAADTILQTSDKWQKYSLELTPKLTMNGNAIYVLPQGGGTVCMDMISLFPQKTFKNRKNGLRADLAQAIADIKPRFLRFPGGCVSHGRGLDNAYRWKNTIGDVAQRKPNWNLWNYHQTYGLGFFEYFLYCEDIACKPLPVLPVGISCQFRNREVEPMSKMQPWVDDALDLVEFANGDTTTTWGKIRANLGHPAPFNLEYICLGNEEDDIPEFRERFLLISNALRAKHPDIKVIGTSGTDDTGNYYNSLWKFSRDSKLDAVDEHYYNSPDWFLNNNHRYDKFDRSGPKVFIGEYASQDDRLFNAISEAAYLTGVERNADIIELTCYAPLLCNENNNQWNPDLIRFDNTSVVKTASYYVQQMYGVNAGDYYLPSELAYTAPNQSNSDEFKGKTGVGTWNTQAQFDDLKVISNNTVLFQEDFSTGSSNWVASAGSFTANGGIYVQSSNAQPALSICQSDINASEYTLTIKAKKTGGGEGFLIPFAYKDSKNYYWLNIGGWGNTQHAIEKVTNGNKSTLLSKTGKINNNQWYEIKLISGKDGVSCYLDSTLLFLVPGAPGAVTASVTEDKESNELIFKLVNSGSTPVTANVKINGMTVNQTIPATVLTGANKTDRNSLSNPALVKPKVSNITVSNNFDYNLPAYSFSVFRVSKTAASTKVIKKVTVRKSKSPIKLVPNPTKLNTARLYFEKNNNSPYDVNVYDLNGKLVSQQLNINGESTTLDMSKLPASTYLVSLRHEGKLYTENLVLK